MGLGPKKGEYDYDTLTYEQLDELIEFHELRAFGEKLTVDSTNFEPLDPESFKKWHELTTLRKHWYEARKTPIAQLHCWTCYHPLKKHVKSDELTCRDIMHPCPTPGACKHKASLLNDN